MPLLQVCVKIIVNTILVLKAGVIYFTLVFGLGFLLGSIRVPFIVPRLGARKAELLEAPFMLVGIIFSAQFVVNHYVLPNTILAPIIIGVIALSLLILSEILLIIVLQKVTIRQYVKSLDKVSGSAYVFLLILFALMPLLIMHY